jgi:hypothetical protein
VAHRVTVQGKDPTGLGRWAWIRLQGRNGIRTQVVTIYCPCDSPGPETVNQQQLWYFRTHGKDLEPRRQGLYEDLFREATSWINKGNHLVMAMDANEEIRTGATDEFFQALGMTEAILTRTKTHNCNLQRQPIDGIWTTPRLKAIGAGYCTFGNGCPSDHQVLWIDLSYKQAFGYKPPYLQYPAIQRLQTRDPRLIAKYNKEVKKLLLDTGLA